MMIFYEKLLPFSFYDGYREIKKKPDPDPEKFVNRIRMRNTAVNNKSERNIYA